MNTASKSEITPRPMSFAKGTKLYTVMSRAYRAGEVPVYTPLGCGIFATRLEASRAMRAAGGGKDGHRSDLTVYSFDWYGRAAQMFTVSVKVMANSQAEAQALAEALVR